MASRTESVASYFLLEWIGSVLRFPFWWYGSGFLGVLGWAQRGLAYRWRASAFSLWIGHFFVPMYGQYDWAGRIVSVVMRFVVLIWRLVALIVEAFAYAFALSFWLLVPPIIFSMFVVNVLQGAFASLPNPFA